MVFVTFKSEECAEFYAYLSRKFVSQLTLYKDIGIRCLDSGIRYPFQQNRKYVSNHNSNSIQKADEKSIENQTSLIR